MDYLGEHQGGISKAIFHIGTVNEAERKILKWMRQHPGSHSVEKIASETETDLEYTYSRLRHLKRAEILTRKIVSGTKEYTYHLSDYATKTLNESGVSNRMILGSYLSGSWQYSRLRIFDFVVMLVMQIFIARWTGLKGFGDVLVISLISAIIAQVSTLGLATALSVYLPTYIEKIDHSFFNGMYRYVLKIAIPFSILLTVLSIGVVLILPMNPVTKGAYIWGFSIIPIWVIWDIAQQPCIALKKWNYAWIPDYFVSPIVWAISLLSLHFVLRWDTPDGVMACKMASAVVLMITQVIMTERLIRKQITNAAHEFERKFWWKKSALLLGINLSNMLRSSIMLIVANFMLGATVAGMFGAVRSALTPTQIIRATFKSAAAPDIPAFFKYGQKLHLHYLAHCMTGAVTLTTLLLLPIGIIFGRDFLGLYGVHSEIAYIVFVIVLIAKVIVSVFGYPNMILSLTKYQGASLLISFGSFFLMLALVAILVLPASGDTSLSMYMLALAYLINQTVFMFVSWWILLRALALSTTASVLFIPPKARLIERVLRRSKSLISDEIAEARSLGQKVPLVGLIGRHDPLVRFQVDDN
jgi:O-antigen/teichoic acid export membrane protein